jgi:hypothetical protein
MGGMKDQLGDDLFDFDRAQRNANAEAVARTRARSADPETSHEAAREIAPKLRALQIIVLRTHAAHPAGMTDLELQHELAEHKSTYRTRRAELTEKGYIYDTGQKKHQDGRNRIVWAISEQGLAFLRIHAGG